MSGLDDMNLFAAVVQHGGFTAAARALGIPLSTISRRVAELESRLGTPLLERTTRRVAPSEAGRVFYQYCHQLQTTAHDAELAVQRLKQEPSGHIRYVMPFSTDDSWAFSVISAFLEKYPKITVEGSVKLDGIDPDATDVDLILDYGSKPETHHPVLSLGQMELSLCASPHYLKRNGTPVKAAQLDDHSMINFTLLTWPEYAPKEFHSVTPNYRISTNEMLMARQVAVDGLGIAWLPKMTTLKQVESGALIEIMPQHRFALPLWMIHRNPQRSTRKVELFVDHVLRKIADSAPWDTLAMAAMSNR
ncbi:LysR family transcriptional regulator [Alcanivorax sp. 1008]|uniref:LysR family transcriptional regulator n=1 Tax=Alcanivorax sp. 1008 TaxID=2816853 RepID=UPI001D6AD830|nr:LysR family transcriptional regulator [Alcanivorax sp. 1008]MCC1498328.1 LysR family transcriptional regulator [Alcanivorax sp. 1008]